MGIASTVMFFMALAQSFLFRIVRQRCVITGKKNSDQWSVVRKMHRSKPRGKDGLPAILPI